MRWAFYLKVEKKKLALDEECSSSTTSGACWASRPTRCAQALPPLLAPELVGDGLHPRLLSVALKALA
jgi:hypothetical protein